jgi:hypothetical protein
MTVLKFIAYSLLSIIPVTLAPSSSWGQEAASPGAHLTVQDVVELTKSGFSEELIVTKIKRNGKAFDLNTDELLELKKAGVTDTVIKFLLDPTPPYTPPAPPKDPASGSAAATKATPSQAKTYPADKLASQVPSDPGLYIFSSASAPAKVDLKFLLGTQESAGMKMMKKKPKVIAYLVGSSSKTRVKSPIPPLYMRLPEGKEIEDLVLVELTVRNAHREIDVGPADPKQELKADSMRQFDSLQVGPSLFKITAAKLDAGEYLFMLLGSAEPPKGVYAKGYDFSLDPMAEARPSGKNH